MIFLIITRIANNDNQAECLKKVGLMVEFEKHVFRKKGKHVNMLSFVYTIE